LQKLGQSVPRERERAFFSVIASEAKQSSFAAAKKLDCFVTSLLAMTRTGNSLLEEAL